MIAILISFLYFVFIFSEYIGSSRDNKGHYVIFAASLIFSVAINGLISMLLIASNTVYIPIFFIQLIIFLLLVDRKKFIEHFFNFFRGFSEDFENIKHNYDKKIIVLVISILILLFLLH